MKINRLALLAAGAGLLMGAGSKHKAHVHGSAKLDIAVESKESTTASMEFESPAEAIYGFEHAPKSDADKAAVDAANAKLRAEFGKMVVFDAALGCSVEVEKIEHDVEKSDHHHHKGKKGHGTHSDIEVDAKVTCQKPLAGTTVNFAFASVFPGLKTVKVQALSAGAQTGSTVKGTGSIKL